MIDWLKTKVRNEQRFAFPLGSFMFITLELLVITQAVLAYRNHFFTVYQMQYFHAHEGLPFLWHFGMWGDFFIISPIVAYLVRRYWDQWRWRSIVFSLTVASTSASLLGWLYTASTIQEAHMQNHQLTAAGVIHMIYMAIAVTIFLEYFLFTPSVSSSELLRVISCLIVFHIFLGTHMALGVLQLFIKLDWYPGEPLKSSVGYITILTIAIAILLQNLELASFANNMRSAAQRLIQFFMSWAENDIFWQKEKINTPHGLLKFLDAIGGRVLEVGFFAVGAFRFYSRHQGIKSLLPAFLVLVFAARFFLSRRSAKVELAISEKLFPSGKLPRDWPVSKESVKVIISVILFFILYMILVGLADKIIFVALVMFIIACIDWNTRRQIHEDITRLFSDDQYSAKIGDKEFEVIEARRKVIREFLDNKPHLKKELGCAAGCAIALSIAVTAHFFGSDLLRYIAYMFLAATLLVNEMVTWRWWSVRDRRLREIDKR